jgi:hypothetical protein
MKPEEKLRAAAELIVQERRMLHHSYSKLAEISSADIADPVERNVYLESFLLHFRNILDFLEPPDSLRKDDVKATDFLTTYVAPNAPTQYRKDINKRLSHMSYSRLLVEPENRSWPITEMLSEIEDTWKSFVGSFIIAEERRSDWFGAQTTDAAPTDSSIARTVSGVVSASTSATEPPIYYWEPPA